MLESENVERLFTFVEMEKELKRTNRSFYQYPGRIPPDAVRTRRSAAACVSCPRGRARRRAGPLGVAHTGTHSTR